MQGVDTPQRVSAIVPYSPKRVIYIRGTDGKWGLPGGRNDTYDEPWSSLAIRKVHHKTGLDIEIERLAPFSLLHYEDSEGRKVMHLFLTGKYTEGNLKPIDKRIAEAKALTREEITNILNANMMRLGRVDTDPVLDGYFKGVGILRDHYDINRDPVQLVFSIKPEIPRDHTLVSKR